MKFKPYEKYKKVDLPWIDKIPSHWKMERNKNFLKARKETVGNHEKDYKLLSLTKRGIIERDMENPKGKFPSSFETYKIVEKNHIIFCLFDIDETPRTVGLSKLDGMITGAYNIFSIDKINRNYYYYYYLYLDKFKMLKPFYTGLRKTINEDTFLGLRTPLPPKEEQDKIADFLDHNLAKIDNFVELTERQIELLKEQKEVLINDAVTKGIDKNVEYKDSGIDWIGEIPKHWEVTRLKHVAKINPSIQADIEDMDFNNQLVFLAMEDISETGELNQSNFKKLKEVKTGYTAFKREDVIVAKITPCFENGKGSYLKKLKTDVGYGTTELVVLRKTDKIYGEYLYKVTKSHLFRKKGEMMMKGSAGQKRITSEFLNSFKLGLPPKKEQEEIVNYIEKETNKIDRTIDLYKTQIELIKEYRTSLIASAVTGKIDVRDF